MSRQQRKLETLTRFGRDLARLSTCKAAQCGCVAFPADFSSVYGIGYNGPAVGRPNDWCCAPDLRQGELARCRCQHAESNLLARMGTVRRAVLFSTTAPCPHCAGLIANSGKVAAVLWDAPYWTGEGLDTLEAAGIRQARASELDETSLSSLLDFVRNRA